VFERLDSETVIMHGGKLLLWEPLVLQNGAGLVPVADRMLEYSCFCLVAIIGPRLKALRDHVRTSEGRPRWQCKAAEKRMAPSAPVGGCLTSVCELGEQGLAFKATGHTTEAVYDLLRGLLKPLKDVVGAEPYCGNGNGAVM
jgi:urease accessory protein UreH